MKRYTTLLFSMEEQGFETRKLRKLLAKEEEEEVQKDVQNLCEKVIEMEVKVLLLQTLHVWSRKPLEEL